MAAVDVADWTPTDDDVAALIPTRTGDETGRALASFSSSTVPTQAQVLAICAECATEVAAFVGDVDDSLTDMAKRTAALAAASYVELQFYPDHNYGSNGVAVALWERYQQSLKALKTAVDNVNAGIPIGGTDSPAPAYAFPSSDDVPRPLVTTYTEQF